MRLAERLSESSLGGQVFLCNSGAEANECAIKLARKHAHARGVEDPEIVVLDGAFHGRTFGDPDGVAEDRPRRSLRAAARRAFAPCRATTPTRCEAAVGESTAAVLIEPIQGEAGVHPIADEVLAAAREACDAARRAAGPRRDPDGHGAGPGSLWAWQQGRSAPT